jgi:hypothetical protein
MMYPPVHERPEDIRSFDRLEMLWERYPRYHEMTTFSTMEALLSEHESWQEEFEDVRTEYDDNGYDRFLIQLSWADLPYRYAAGKRMKEAGPLPANPYVDAFLDQFAGIDTDKKSPFSFPGKLCVTVFCDHGCVPEGRIPPTGQKSFPGRGKSSLSGGL